MDSIIEEIEKCSDQDDLILQLTYALQQVLFTDDRDLAKKQAKTFLFLLTEEYLCSEFFQNHLNEAILLNKKIIGISESNLSLPNQFKNYKFLILSEFYKNDKVLDETRLYFEFTKNNIVSNTIQS